jgi:phage shock protein PspC (stress-responsive transcriptional regulator)
MVAGVCGGLGRYFGVNPTYYRVGFVVLALLGGAGILIYLAALLVMPNEGETDSVASEILRNHRDHPWALVALALVAVAGLSLLSHATLWPNGDAAWIFLLVGAGIILWVRRTEAGKKPRILRTFLIILGTLVAFVLVLGAIFASVSHVHLSRGVGDRNYHPASYTDLHPSYKLGVGSLQIDLSDVRFPPGTQRVVADVGAGDVTIIVPNDVSTHVDATADFGQVEVFDRTDGGRNSSLTNTSVVGKGLRQLSIDAHVGTGKVEVRRAFG